MARADLVTDLIRYGIAGDKVRLSKVVEAIITEERAKNHTVLADRLEQILRTVPKNHQYSNGNTIQSERLAALFKEVQPELNFDDLVLPKEVKQISGEVVEEQHRSDLLRSYNLEPRNRILLVGPPGNGKTSLAEAFANALMVPLLIVRYEGVIGAFLGETTLRLHRLLEYVRTRQCVLFFDEFETLAKERGDNHETGEIKRVVSALLMEIDSLPSHVVVIGATNHAELLDRAVWRRFQVRMNLPIPTRSRLAEWFSKFEKRINVSLGYAPETLAKKLYGINFAEAEEFGLSAFRQFVLSEPGANMKRIVDKTIKNWDIRSIRIGQPDNSE